MKPTFSISESLRVGWEKTREHSGLVFSLVVIFFALSFAQATLNLHAGIAAQLVSALLSMVEVFFGISATVISLGLVRNTPVSLRDLIPGWSVTWRYIISSIFAGCIIAICAAIPVVIGFFLYNMQSFVDSAIAVLCICIGIGLGLYFILQYSMVKFVSVDGEIQGVVAILRRSALITSRIKWRLLLFFLVLVLINVVGALVLLVGLLITIPVSMIASAYVYVQLSEQVIFHT